MTPTPIVSPAHHCKSGILLPTRGRIGPHSRTPRLKAILGASSSKISYECFIVAPRRRSGGCLPRTWASLPHSTVAQRRRSASEMSHTRGGAEPPKRPPRWWLGSGALLSPPALAACKSCVPQAPTHLTSLIPTENCAAFLSEFDNFCLTEVVLPSFWPYYRFCERCQNAGVTPVLASGALLPARAHAVGIP